MRQLHEDACAIASARIAPASATMRQVVEHAHALLDNLVRFLARDVGYKANSAGVMLECRIVQPFRLSWPLASRVVAQASFFLWFLRSFSGPLDENCPPGTSACPMGCRNPGIFTSLYESV